MRPGIFHIALLVSTVLLHQRSRAQTPNVYTIKADSVKITNCDSAELILENHTQGIPGFLFNTGNGRTIFKRGLVNLGNGSYQIGADTLHAWIQGGDKFNSTGVLGTNDNNHLDLYTNGLERVRLTNTGNLLMGTTADNGSLLQVNGNVSIGSAGISSAGILTGTNAILFDHFIPKMHAYDYSGPFISQLNDIIYNYRARLLTTITGSPSTVDTIDIVFPSDELTSSSGISYSSGALYCSFWSNGSPQTISVTTKDYLGNWYGPYTTTTSNATNLNYGGGGAGLYKVSVNGPGNYMTEMKIVMTAPSGGSTNLQDMAYILTGGITDGLVNPYPYVSKYGDEHIYNYFYLKNGGVDNVRLSPYTGYPSYFLNSIGIGTTSPSAQLHTTGTVRFAGLTQDSTQTRVIVSDASGNLYYRSASSLAIDEPLRSSLAVNGPIAAKSLRLSATGWPDYVFDSSYTLPPLQHLENYIHQNNHLPGLPSAASAEKDGVDVGITQAALLKKVEELTLYVIQQAHEMKALRKQVDRMSKQHKTKK